MRRIYQISLILFVCFALISIYSTSCNGSEGSKSVIRLWPEIEPYETGYLKVSKIHEIYYELCGSPEGKPVFLLHGGPGGSSSPYMRRFCDPAKFLMVLYDQRGSGKSKPFGEIKENTTQHLVEDIEHLRKHLKLEKVILFGGSWGSTLALAYAETYPQNVSGLVLRGIFTATAEEIDHFYHGGVSMFFPEVYEALMNTLPDPSKKPVPDTLFRLIKNGTEPEKKKYSEAWAWYEGKISGLVVPDKIIKDWITNYNPYAFAIMENYYMANGCFLEEGQLSKNADKIAHIPTFMVNGRYDMICPPKSAYRLHKLLPKSELVIADAAGHWMGERPIERALLKAMKSFE